MKLHDNIIVNLHNETREKIEVRWKVDKRGDSQFTFRLHLYVSIYIYISFSFKLYYCSLISNTHFSLTTTEINKKAKWNKKVHDKQKREHYRYLITFFRVKRKILLNWTATIDRIYVVMITQDSTTISKRI